MKERGEISEYKRFSDEWLIDRYFKAGSVDDALQSEEGTIPFSSADMHRKLESAGIIKSAGRQTSFSEALHFFKEKQMEPGTPLESIYKNMPLTFQTSMETLHRIYNRMLAVKQSSVVSRHATALLITEGSDPSQILVGAEVFSRTKYGKVAGQLSLPMTFSKPTDTASQRILRVLQQEVVTADATSKKFKDPTYVKHILSNVQGPFLTYRLLDVEISCFHLTLPQTLTNFSSYKLTGHQFVNGSAFEKEWDSKFRIGVPEIVQIYFQERELIEQEVPVVISDFNLAIAAVPSQRPA